MRAWVKHFLGVTALAGNGCATGAELSSAEERVLPDADGATPFVDGSKWEAVDAGSEAVIDGGSDESNEPLSCDPRFEPLPLAPQATEPFTVSFTDDPGYVHVALEVTGPGTPSASWNGVTGEGPYTWSYQVEGHAAGVLALAFYKNKPPGSSGKKIATCSLEVSP